MEIFQDQNTLPVANKSAANVFFWAGRSLSIGLHWQPATITVEVALFY